MKFSSLADWLGWLEKNHPKEIDLGLDRVRQVADRLGLLKPEARVIIVAGTNGKGSCATAIAALLRADHCSTGVYTSPHLLVYNERIQVDGVQVSDELICDAFDLIFNASDDISLTYFEYGTLAALIIFKQQHVDYIVLEVGLGGRLDAVNILDADVAVITSIAIDHQEWLGDTRELIGIEKAGILRAHQLFICADENPPKSVVDIAARLQTKSYFITKDFSFTVKNDNWNWQGKSTERKAIHLSEMRAPSLPLPSMAAALQVVQLLGVKLISTQLEQTLSNLNLAGRFQKIKYLEREFILDVAHNPAATAYLSKRLGSECVAGKIFAIVAMMSDKDCLASVANLVSLVDEWMLLDLKNVPRAATIAALTENLLSLGEHVNKSGDITTLMNELLAIAQPQDRILIFGSFFTVAAALDYFQAASAASRGML